MKINLERIVKNSIECTIITISLCIHHRQRATRLSHSSFLYLLSSTISATIVIERRQSIPMKNSRTVLGF